MRKYAFLCFVVTCVLSLAGYLMYIDIQMVGLFLRLLLAKI